MTTMAIDPGPVQSAYVVMTHDMQIVAKGILENWQLRSRICTSFCDTVVIEQIKSYGMSVGESIFRTCYESGRMIEAAQSSEKAVYMLPRAKVKIHVCGSMRAKDGNIRQAIIDRYPATGGGKLPQIGIKSAPGPLFGVSKDVWAALAVAITFVEAPGQASKVV